MLRFLVMAQLCVFVGAFMSEKVSAYETDQYSFVTEELSESLPIVDPAINRGIEFIAGTWSGPRDDVEFAKRVFRLFSNRQFEKWVNEHPSIDKSWDKEKSIYRVTGALNSPIIRFKRLAATFNLNNVHVGADKMSHFFGVGGIYYILAMEKNADKTRSEQDEIVVKHGVFTEKAYWGELTTNVFSNADLVSNYEGYLFYRSLFENEVVAGKKAIIRWEDNRPIVQRRFTFADHVNDYWSEAMNPSWYQFSLRRRVLAVLRMYCSQGLLEARPDLLVSKQDELLREKYAHLQLEEKAQRFRLDNVCAEFRSWPVDEQAEYLEELQERLGRFDDDSTGAATDVQRLSADMAAGLPTCRSKALKALEEHRLIVSWTHGIQMPLEKAYLAGSFVDSPLAKLKEANGKTCIHGELPSELPGVRGRWKAKVVSCFSKRGGVVELDHRYYKISLGNFQRESLEGLASLEDREAYLYRTLPMLCRWY